MSEIESYNLHNNKIKLSKEETRAAIRKRKMTGERKEITGLMRKWNYRVCDHNLLLVCVFLKRDGEREREGTCNWGENSLVVFLCVSSTFHYIQIHINPQCWTSVKLNILRCTTLMCLKWVDHIQYYNQMSVCASAPVSGATRGSVLRLVPGLRVWTEAGGPGRCGGSAAGPVGAVYPPPWGTVTAQRK